MHVPGLKTQGGSLLHAHLVAPSSDVFWIQSTGSTKEGKHKITEGALYGHQPGALRPVLNP